jgi:thiamine pyrophosphokinase
VFCLGAKAEGVCLENLKYNLENATLTGDFPLGVSNHFIGQEAKISVADGILTILYDVANGFPAEEGLC